MLWHAAHTSLNVSSPRAAWAALKAPASNAGGGAASCALARGAAHEITTAPTASGVFNDSTNSEVLSDVPTMSLTRSRTPQQSTKAPVASHKLLSPARPTSLGRAEASEFSLKSETVTGAWLAPGEAVITYDAIVDSPAVVFDRVSFAFDGQVVLRDVSFSVPRGTMRILLGASGAGKSIVLKLILGLFRPDSGTIHVNGQRIDQMSEPDLMAIRGDIGMSFQETALFDSLTVAENVGYRLYEEVRLPLDEVRARVVEVLGFVGLGEYIDQMPSALSGGQRRRVAIARAIAARPRLLLFDDPTTGLDPITANSVNDEVVKLRDIEQVTAIVVTHQIRDAYYVAKHEVVRANGNINIMDVSGRGADRAQFMVLHEGRIYFEGTADELLAREDPYLRDFLFMTLPPW